MRTHAATRHVNEKSFDVAYPCLETIHTPNMSATFRIGSVSRTSQDKFMQWQGTRKVVPMV